MALHRHCKWNCGGTNCDAPERMATVTNQAPDNSVWVYTGYRWRRMTVRDAAIEEIKSQPFFEGKPHEQR